MIVNRLSFYNETVSDFDSSKLPKLRDVQFSYLKCVRIFSQSRPSPHKNTTSTNEDVGIKQRDREQSKGGIFSRMGPIDFFEEKVKDNEDYMKENIFRRFSNYLLLTYT